MQQELSGSNELRDAEPVKGDRPVLLVREDAEGQELPLGRAMDFFYCGGLWKKPEPAE